MDFIYFKIFLYIFTEHLKIIQKISMENIDLLHIIPFASLGGTEKDCLNFISESNKKNIKNTIWILGSEGPMIKQWQACGAEILILNILHLNQKKILKQLNNLSRERLFDGILYWSTIKLPIIRYGLKNQRCRMAVHVGNPSNFMPHVIIKQMLEDVYYQSSIPTCLFACSEYVQQTLIIHPYYRHFKSIVQYNPVPLLETNPHQPRTLSKESEIIIGMTARLDPIKDHKTLLLAFKNLLQEYPRAKLWLLGDGLLKNKLIALAEQLSIINNVSFLGNVEEVYEKLQLMDIFVYSTTLKEGLGNSVSEAMANGLPCIVSDLPMMNEIAGEKDNLIFFKPNNSNDLLIKLKMLINSKELREKLSNNAFNRAINTFNAAQYFEKRMQYLFK
jgi:glycosyltransferase involved in cell wall biosynthesis